MSYSGDPTNSDRDATRFHAGDTDSTDELLVDAEYDYLLDGRGVLQAAAEACEAISAKLARKVDTTVGRASKSLSQQAEAYAQRARALRKRAAVAQATIRAGGISEADKDTQEDNDDRVKPAFKVGMHDHEGLVSDNEPQ